MGFLIIYIDPSVSQTMGGRPEETSDDEILDVFRSSADPVLSTAEVADALSYSQAGTYKRLVKLRDEGKINSKMLGDVRAWWIAEKR